MTGLASSNTYKSEPLGVRVAPAVYSNEQLFAIWLTCLRHINWSSQEPMLLEVHDDRKRLFFAPQELRQRSKRCGIAITPAFERIGPARIANEGWSTIGEERKVVQIGPSQHVWATLWGVAADTEREDWLGFERVSGDLHQPFAHLVDLAA